MKKAGNIVLIIILVFATGGIPFTRHYCGSSMGSFSIFSTPKSCCDSHCDKCHNVFKYSKINDSFVAGSFITTQFLKDFITLHQSQFIDLFNNIFVPPSPDFIHQRKFLIAEAGPSPAFLGNFRF
jgi:hypothetical protein